MAEIAASMVMDLRGRTGLGMMECKKALTEAGGDIAKAEELLRIKSGIRASKAADRIAAEGIVALDVSSDGKVGAMVEVNCETDFVAKNEEFRAFAAEVAKLAARDDPADVAALAAGTLASGQTVEARRVALVQKIGENLSIRRFVRRTATGKLYSYVHGVRIGVLVDVIGGDDRRSARTSPCTSRRASRLRSIGRRFRPTWWLASATSRRRGRPSRESRPTSSRK